VAPEQSAGDADAALQSVLTSLESSARHANLARSRVIADALQAAATSGLGEEQRTPAAQAAHQIAGSAGTFGHRRASRLAAALEQYLLGVALETADPPGLAEARLELGDLQDDLAGGQRETG